MAREPSGTWQDSEGDRLDRALLMRIAENRDTHAMESFYKRMQPRIARFLRRFTTDPALIEESANDVMIAVWEKADGYEGRSKVSSWVFTIAYRKCLDMIKKQKRRDLWIQLVGETAPDVPDTEDPLASDGYPEIAEAVRRLSPKQRIVIELCYFEGYSLEEISYIVKCPLNTVKTRLHHARKKIKDILDAASASANTAIE
ncbi:MAG: RNA polymerase sigma factor [Pseudomonadota bacterium]